MKKLYTICALIVWTLITSNVLASTGRTVKLVAFVYVENDLVPAQALALLRGRPTNGPQLGGHNFGYSDKKGWFLFETHGSEASANLYIKNPLFTSLKAYAGDQELIRRNLGGLDYFEVKLNSQILLEVTSNTIHDLSVELLSVEEISRQALVHSIIVIGYLVIIFSLMAASLTSAFGEKDKIIHWYSTVIISFHGFAILSLFAFPINWICPEWTAAKGATIISSESLACIFSLLFATEIVRDKTRRNKFKWLLLTSSVTLLLFSWRTQSFLIAAAAFLISLLTIVYVMFVIHRNRATLGSMTLYRFAWSAIGLGTIIFSLQYIGLIETFNYRYAILVGALADAGITLAIFVKQITVRRKTRDRLHYSLRGIASYSEIEKLFTDDDEILLNSQFADLTVMFIDLCKFSKVVEQENEKNLEAVEACIGTIMIQVKQIIFDHKGIVNKSLGDGLLVYFGISLSGKAKSDAERAAVECSIAIHRAVIHLIASRKCEYPLPTRIGISSGRVRIGNMAEDRVDYTVLGHAVNIAQRLEAGSAVFETLLTDSVKQSISIRDCTPTDKFITIKNDEKLLPVWGVSVSDPQMQDELKEAVRRYSEFHNQKRNYERFSCMSDVRIRVQKPLEDLWTIVDYSSTGLKVLSRKNLCVKVRIIGRIDNFLLSCEVVRSTPCAHGFEIGVQIISFDEIEERRFLSMMHALNSSYIAS